MDIRAIDWGHNGLLNVTNWDPSGDGQGQRAIADIMRAMIKGGRNMGRPIRSLYAVIDNYGYSIEVPALNKSVSIKRPKAWNFGTEKNEGSEMRRTLKLGSETVGTSPETAFELINGHYGYRYNTDTDDPDRVAKLPDFSSWGSCQSIMSGAEFAEIADDVNAIEGQIFRIIVKSEIQKMLIETHGTPGEFSGEYDAQVRGADHKSAYDAAKLAPVLKALKRMKEVKFSMGTDVPCKVSARVGGGELEYYLAPWIESNGPECDE